MEQIHRSSIEADNRLRSLETDQRRLELCHQMLNNISTQATLLLGFSLATYGADLLPIVLRDDVGFCLYKTRSSMIFGAVFLMCNVCTIGFCLLVILFSSLLILRSQEALLYVGGSAAVWRTNGFMKFIYMWYALALANFLVNAMLLFWVYLGVGLWRSLEDEELDNPQLESYKFVVTYEGKTLVRCLDPQNDDDHRTRNLWGGACSSGGRARAAGSWARGTRKRSTPQHTAAIDRRRASVAAAPPAPRRRSRRFPPPPCQAHPALCPPFQWSMRYSASCGLCSSSSMASGERAQWIRPTCSMPPRVRLQSSAKSR